MNDALEQLKKCADLSDLRTALYVLCARYGGILRLDILEASQQGKRQALCFLRLHTPEQEQQFMTDLGVGRFSGDLVVIVDLSPSKPLTMTTKNILPCPLSSPSRLGLTVEKAGSHVESSNKPFDE